MQSKVCLHLACLVGHVLECARFVCMFTLLFFVLFSCAAKGGGVRLITPCAG